MKVEGAAFRSQGFIGEVGGRPGPSCTGGKSPPLREIPQMPSSTSKRVKSS